MFPVLRRKIDSWFTEVVENERMYTGTLIHDLFSTVAAAEDVGFGHRSRRAQANPSKDAIKPDMCDCKRKALEAEQLAQAPGLSAADGDLGLFLVVHPQLVRALEPRNDFADTVDIHQIRPVSPPE